MKKIITLCSSIILLATTQAYAQYGTAITTVSYLSVYPTSAIVKLNASSANEGGCTFSGSDKYYSLSMDGSQKSNIQYAALLTAYTTEANIRLQINGCNGAFPSILSVEMPK